MAVSVSHGIFRGVGGREGRGRVLWRRTVLGRRLAVLVRVHDSFPDHRRHRQLGAVPIDGGQGQPCRYQRTQV